MAETERNNLPIAEEPEFTTEIPAIRPDDLVHFTQMNAMLESLLGNDVFLQRLANKMIENSLIAHVLDCENSQMVLGADQGPAITGLIDEVNESVTQLYSDISIRYNEEDENIQIFQNGEWKDLPTGSFPDAPVEINFTITASYFNVVHKRCIKYGNMVHVFIYAKIVHVTKDEFIATNLPKSPFQSFLPCFIADGYSMPTDISSVLINNGTLSLNEGQASKFTMNKYFLLNTTYICS